MNSVKKILLGIALMIWSIFSSAKDYPEVAVNQEDGFVDLTFHIASSKKTRSGGYEFQVKGTLVGNKVGFAIELLPTWKPQPIEGTSDHFYWGEANFKNIGSETKEFVSALAALYDLAPQKFGAVSEIRAQVVGLACDPEKIDKAPCKMKFFFNSDGEEDIYSEVYINVDSAAGILEFNEKDNDYRAPLLRSLSSGA